MRTSTHLQKNTHLCCYSRGIIVVHIPFPPIIEIIYFGSGQLIIPPPSFFLPLTADVMRLYSTWILWSKNDFKDMNPDSYQVATLLFITRKKEIEILYKPTPVIDAGNNLQGIVGIMFDDGGIPAIIKIDSKEIGSCSTIQNFEEIPETFRPEIPLLVDSVKDTKWEKANKEIALIIVPTLVPLPFGTDIKSTILDNNFIKEMQAISPQHGFLGKDDVQCTNRTPPISVPTPSSKT